MGTALPDAMRRSIRRSDLARWIVDLEGRGFLLSTDIGRMVAAHALDVFWDGRSSSDLRATLEELGNVADSLVEVQGAHSLAETVGTARRMLAFLHGEYAPRLRAIASACFVAGSLSYGRFYSLRGHNDRNPSDLDLVLVVDRPLVVDDLLVPGVLDDRFGEGQRLVRYWDERLDPNLDLLSLKLWNGRDEFVVSLTLATLAGFDNCLDVGHQDDRSVRLHWRGSFGGGPNVQTDLAGRAYDAPYSEEQGAAGNRLTLPLTSWEMFEGRALGRPNGFASMITPAFDRVFASDVVEARVRRFAEAINAMAQAYRAAGLQADICNLHVRQKWFSPLFKQRMSSRLAGLISRPLPG